MLLLSYVWPVATMTGSCISSIEIGHAKWTGIWAAPFSPTTPELPAPPAALDEGCSPACECWPAERCSAAELDCDAPTMDAGEFLALTQSSNQVPKGP